MVYAYLTLISVNIFLENFWYIFLFDLLVVMRFLRPLLKHLTQLINFITCESSAPFFVIYKAGREPTPYWW